MNLNKIDYICLGISIIIAFFVSYLSCKYYLYGSGQSSEIEAFENDTTIETNNNIYDKFYAKIYDKLFTDSKRTAFELASIINTTITKAVNPFKKEDIRILDAGCGTGIMSSLIGKMYPVTCLDKSNDMLNVAKTRQSEHMKLLQGDIKDASTFNNNEFSHILCTYFTMYYFKDINHIFENFSKWVKPDGFVVIHLVDKKAFDPILNPASPFVLMDLQSHVDKRKTDSTVVFNNFTYKSDFILESNDKAYFEETFDYKDGKVRKQKHGLYMYNKIDYVHAAKKYGLDLMDIKSQAFSGYGNHYIFIFRKIKNDKSIELLN